MHGLFSIFKNLQESNLEENLEINKKLKILSLFEVKGIILHLKGIMFSKYHYLKNVKAFYRFNTNIRCTYLGAVHWAKYK